MDGEEHSNYSLSATVTTGMREFLDTGRYCSLLDLRCHGPKFAWCNKKEECLICKKVDRILINDKWLGHYPNSYSSFESGCCSDHARGRIELESDDVRWKKPFKFSNALATVPKFHSVIVEHWQASNPLFVSTSALFWLRKRLKELKPSLRILGKEVLGDLTRRKNDAYEELCEKQQATLQNPYKNVMAAENIAFEKWQKLVDLEEGYLQ